MSIKNMYGYILVLTIFSSEICSKQKKGICNVSSDKKN